MNYILKICSKVEPWTKQNYPKVQTETASNIALLI